MPLACLMPSQSWLSRLAPNASADLGPILDQFAADWTQTPWVRTRETPGVSVESERLCVLTHQTPELTNSTVSPRAIRWDRDCSTRIWSYITGQVETHSGHTLDAVGGVSQRSFPGEAPGDPAGTEMPWPYTYDKAGVLLRPVDYTDPPSMTWLGRVPEDDDGVTDDWVNVETGPYDEGPQSSPHGHTVLETSAPPFHRVAAFTSMNDTAFGAGGDPIRRTDFLLYYPMLGDNWIRISMLDMLRYPWMPPGVAGVLGTVRFDIPEVPGFDGTTYPLYRPHQRIWSMDYDASGNRLIVAASALLPATMSHWHDVAHVHKIMGAVFEIDLDQGYSPVNGPGGFHASDELGEFGWPSTERWTATGTMTCMVSADDDVMRSVIGVHCLRDQVFYALCGRVRPWRSPLSGEVDPTVVDNCTDWGYGARYNLDDSAIDHDTLGLPSPWYIDRRSNLADAVSDGVSIYSCAFSGGEPEVREIAIAPMADARTNGPMPDPTITAYAPGFGGLRLAVTPRSLGGGGVDLIASQPGFLHRCQFSAGGGIGARSLVSAGEAWAGPDAIATPSGDATPTLARDWHEDHFCWYHTSTAAKALHSADMGATWEEWADHAGLSHLRAEWHMGRTILVAHDGTQLQVYGSSDWGQTLESLATVTAPRQLACIRSDRHGILHLVYTDGGRNILHRWSVDGVTWSTPDTWATDAGACVMACGSLYSAVAWADSTGALHVGLVASDGTSVEEIGAPAGTVRPQQIGLAFGPGDNLWLAAYTGASTVTTWWSADTGATWTVHS